MTEVIRHRVASFDDDEEEEYEEEDFVEPELKLDNTFNNVLVVDNLPVVNEDKYEKLCNVITKIYSALDIADGGLYMPKDKNKSTQGYAFLFSIHLSPFFFFFFFLFPTSLLFPYHFSPLPLHNPPSCLFSNH